MIVLMLSSRSPGVSSRRRSCSSGAQSSVKLHELSAFDSQLGLSVHCFHAVSQKTSWKQFALAIMIGQVIVSLGCSFSEKTPLLSLSYKYSFSKQYF